MAELHTGPKHPQGGANPEYYFKLQVVPQGYQPKGEGEGGYLALYKQAYSGRVRHVSLGRLPIQEKTTPIIKPRVGDNRQPWSATHLGDGNCDFTHIARGTCWHSLSVLGHGS